jgi:Anti-sigma-K factor rskA
MTSHDWHVASRVAYVTRTLDAGDERIFADHLTHCEDCRAAIAAIERELEWLPMGVKPAMVRPGFRGEIARAILTRERPVRRNRWAVILAAASLLLTTGTLVAVTLPARREATRLATLLAQRDAQISQRDSQLTVLRDTLSVVRQSSRVLQTPITINGKSGGLVIFADDTHRRWQVVMHGLPPAPTGQAYQFWFICADGMIRDATLVGDPLRPAVYTLVLPPNSGAVLGASLTLEPAQDSAAGGPKGRELAHLLL